MKRIEWTANKNKEQIITKIKVKEKDILSNDHSKMSISQD